MTGCRWPLAWLIVANGGDGDDYRRVTLSNGRLVMNHIGVKFLILFALLSPVRLNAQTHTPDARVRTVADSLPGAVGGVAVDRLGAIYVADFGEQVFKIWPDGRVSVFATGLYGASGNAIDQQGNLFQSNFSGNYISRIDRHGDQEIYAEGFSGPVGIAIDSTGALYVCNCSANTIARVEVDRSVTVFATGDMFNCPNGITRAPNGNLYVVNFSDGRMIEVTPTGDTRVFANIPGGGNGHVAFARDNLYVTSFRGQRIFRVAMDGEVSPVAGTGAFGGNDGAALDATFLWPNGIAVGPTGDRVYVNEFLNRTPPAAEAPPAPLSRVRQITFPTLAAMMVTALAEGGIDAMVAMYREWKSAPATSGQFTEVQINQLGYELMGQGNLDAAIAVFELNVESYPRSFNTYDSLAEAYMNDGQQERAIEFYEKSLELNPANQNAVDKLRELREASGGT